MPRKAVVVISLVDESENKGKEHIEKEILEELSKGFPPLIPWMKNVEKVEVVEA